MTKLHTSTESLNGPVAVQLTPVVLAGGSGTRLWPLSREDYPKQLLRLTGSNTLLQETLTRLAGLEDRNPRLEVTSPVLVCNEEHRFLVCEQLESIGVRADPGRIILEPVGRNTAPALTLAALRLASLDHDPLLLVMPSDHVIADAGAFQRAVMAGAELAAGRCIVTFGITPSRAETGYGYIRSGGALSLSDDALNASSISAFVEKPAPEIARRYVESGEYFWNAGLFMMRASVWLEAIGACRADILEACRLAHDSGTSDSAFYRVDAQAFARVPSDSIDYAVMEP
ncbi:MAG: mannose-1-phosphate guanylyltransferase, partial [Gammaproteobacteria bacterium]